MNKKEKYALNLQDLMNVIPTSTVVKHVVYVDDFRSIQWSIDGYIVYSSLRDVYSVGMDEKEKFEFFLKAKDYKKFVLACEARRKELFEKNHQTIK